MGKRHGNSISTSDQGASQPTSLSHSVTYEMGEPALPYWVYEVIYPEDIFSEHIYYILFTFISLKVMV